MPPIETPTKTQPTLDEIAYELFTDVIRTLSTNHAAELETAANDNAYSGTPLHEPLQQLMAGLRERHREDILLERNTPYALHVYQKHPNKKNLGVLVEILHGNIAQREAVIDIVVALMGTTNPAHKQIVLETLKAEKTNNYTRAYIIEGLRGTTNKEAIGLLLDLLKTTPAPAIKRTIAFTLQGSSDRRVSAYFLKLFRSEDAEAKHIGAIGLKGIQTRAVTRALQQYSAEHAINSLFKDIENNPQNFDPRLEKESPEIGTLYAVVNALAKDPQTLASIKNEWDRNTPQARQWIHAFIRWNYTAEEANEILTNWGDKSEKVLTTTRRPTEFLTENEYWERTAADNIRIYTKHRTFFQKFKSGTYTPKDIGKLVNFLSTTQSLDLLRVAAHTLLVLNTPESIQALVDAQTTEFGQKFNYPSTHIREAIAQLDPDNAKHRALLTLLLNGPLNENGFPQQAAQTLARSEDPIVTKILTDFIVKWRHDTHSDGPTNSLLEIVIKALQGRYTLPVYEAMVNLLDKGIANNRFHDAILEALDGQHGLKNDAGELFVKNALMRHFLESNQRVRLQERLLKMLLADSPAFHANHLESFSRVRASARQILTQGLFKHVKPEASRTMNAEVRLFESGLPEETIAQLATFVPQQIRDAGALMTSAFYLMGAQLLNEQPKSDTAKYIQESESHTADRKLLTGLEILAFGARKLITQGHGYTAFGPTEITQRQTNGFNGFRIKIDAHNPKIQITYNLENPNQLIRTNDTGKTVTETIVDNDLGLNSLMFSAASAASVPMPLTVIRPSLILF